MKPIFITGTDTDIGKTYVSSLLLKQFNAAGYKTFGIKPIASGCQYNDENILQNDDALTLQKAASLFRPYSIVNPISLKDSVAPHLAAVNMGLKLTKDNVKKNILSSLQSEVDINLIEGVGGWAVPLNDDELFSEVIAELNIPVILVVGIKLGCLNHAILTYQSIMQMNVPFIGWIANCLVPETLLPEENIATLKQWIKQPCLGVVPYAGESNINIDGIVRFVAAYASKFTENPM